MTQRIKYHPQCPDINTLMDETTVCCLSKNTKYSLPLVGSFIVKLGDYSSGTGCFPNVTM